MAELSWFPYDVDEWEERIQKMGLSAEEEGLLMRLCRGAWRSELPATLTGKPDELARLVGAQWKKALPLLKANFTAVDEHPGMLRCAWLAELYEKQLSKHRSYSNRGQLGGLKAQAGKKAEPPPKAAVAQAEVAKNQAELPENGGSASEAFPREDKEGVSSSPSDYRANTLVETDIARATPLGPEGPQGRTGEIDDPYKLAELAAAPEVTRKHAVEKYFSDKYDQELLDTVDRWRPAHDREYSDHRILASKALGLYRKQCGPTQLAAIDMATAIRIRDAEGWPLRTTWVAKRRDDFLAKHQGAPA